MVLDSQMPRSGFRRSYMSTRRRYMPRWPWVALAVVALASVGLYGMFRDDAPAAPGPEDGDSPAVVEVSENITPSAMEATKSAPKPEVKTPASKAQATQTPVKTPAPAPVPARSAAGAVAATSNSPPAQRDRMLQGMKLIEQGQLVEGRALLSKLLTGHPPLSSVDEQRIRDVLTSINQELIFSPKVAPGDPLVERYVVQSGDLLARIAPRYKVTYQLLEQINRIEARHLQAGKTIKLIKGPFFAVVSKSQFRMDIYLMDAQGAPVYVRSFAVGLGENDATPAGTWLIKKGSKTVNPDWRSPRTGEYFTADDPKNPIGEYWLALEGLDDNTKDKLGFGIHGTIDPDSIGRMMSLGCVRLNAPDIEQVFKLLLDGESKVYIVP